MQPGAGRGGVDSSHVLDQQCSTHVLQHCFVIAHLLRVELDILKAETHYGQVVGERGERTQT